MRDPERGAQVAIPGHDVDGLAILETCCQYFALRTIGQVDLGPGLDLESLV